MASSMHTDHSELPPRVNYGMTAWGQALDGLLHWSAQRKQLACVA